MWGIPLSTYGLVFKGLGDGLGDVRLSQNSLVNIYNNHSK
jgi:hypothetical protein